MDLNRWNVNVSTTLPEKVATAVSKLAETMIGTTYIPVAYLGDQTVNGVNYAVLAEQVVATGVENAVVLTFNEKPNEMEVTLVGITHLLSNGMPFGGTNIVMSTEIPADAQQVWDKAFEDRIGMSVKPFAFVGTKVTDCANYIYAAEYDPMVPGGAKRAFMVVINAVDRYIAFTDMLATMYDKAVGYTFSW